MNPNYEQVARRAAHRCEYCHAPEAIFNFPFEVEHIIPVSREGIDIEYNWALSCRSCNLHKASSIDSLDPKEKKIVRLFNPREDIWGKNFKVKESDGEIEGITAIGRVTVMRLEMNSMSQKTAR